VVGADGLNSIVAAQARLNRRDPWPRRIALVSHFTNVSDMSDCGEMHVDRDGYMGIAKVGQLEANVALVIPKSSARELKRDLSGFLLRWIRERPHLARRFESARLVGNVSATGPFARRARRTWAPGVALTGDAADFFDPFTGEGIYTALRGGEILAEHLQRYCAEGLRDDELRRYAAARHSEFGSKLTVERIVGLAVGFPPLMNRVAAVLSRRKDMADLLVGVTGDFVPAREVLRVRYILGLLL
jgi:flavin-dependent dehydrogenase